MTLLHPSCVFFFVMNCKNLECLVSSMLSVCKSEWHIGKAFEEVCILDTQNLFAG